jgi:hypothetical protein
VPAPLVAMAAKQALANPKTRKLIIGGAAVSALLPFAAVGSLLFMMGGAVAAIEGGSSASAVTVGAGTTGALSFTSPHFQAELSAPPGTIVVEYPGNGIPPPSLAPYALPTVTIPGSGAPPSSPTNGNGIPGQCTYWAELNWVEPTGDDIVLTGNADQLVASAKAQGVAAVDTPAPGELVVWGAGDGYSEYGHVAVVVAVNAAAGSYVVSEMNYDSTWEIDFRVVSDSAGDVLGFLPTAAVIPQTG